MDIEDAIAIAARLLKGRIAKQVWRDYHKHAFARRCYADPSDMGEIISYLAWLRPEGTSTIIIRRRIGRLWRRRLRGDRAPCGVSR